MIIGPSVPAQRGSFRLTLYSLLVVELFSGVLQVYFVPLYPPWPPGSVSAPARCRGG